MKNYSSVIFAIGMIVLCLGVGMGFAIFISYIQTGGWIFEIDGVFGGIHLLLNGLWGSICVNVISISVASFLFALSRVLQVLEKQETYVETIALLLEKSGKDFGEKE